MPEEYRKFQSFSPANAFGTDGKWRVSQKENKAGDKFGGYDTVKINNQLIVDDGYTSGGDNESFYFLPYELDNGRIIMASKKNGEVICRIHVGISDQLGLRPHSAKENPIMIRKQKRTFGDVTVHELYYNNDDDSESYVDTTNALSQSLIIGSSASIPDKRMFKFYERDDQAIRIPSLPPISELGPVPEVTGFNDPLPQNKDAKRAVVGSAYIPSILVNDDLSSGDRIKKNPYYTLEYRQYWHLLWSDLFTKGSNKLKTEVTGALDGAQENMKEVVGMSIGADLGLKFTETSDPFKKQIVSGLNSKQSHAAELGQTTTITNVENPEDVTVRYAKFARAHEFVLKDSDGKVTEGPWVVVDGNEMYLKRYKK
ncbi:hypothetical protein [Bacillus albus]|uniref:hypothetical protein n=1 Tax=Bacillus albus TaxID=2026189 RepID=UPI0013EAC250|nr:hypothetical protein [Bacillus albus]